MLIATAQFGGETALKSLEDYHRLRTSFRLECPEYFNFGHDVVLAKGFSPSAQLKFELQDHTKLATAPYKYPREIEFLDELPKTVSGKIRRIQLRNRG